MLKPIPYKTWISFFCLALMTACTGVGGLGSAGLTPASDSGTSSESPMTESGQTGLEDSGPDFPIASIPIPTLKSSLVYRTDSNGYTPVVGMAGVVDEGYRNDAYQMAVSSEPLAIAKAMHSIRQKQNLAELNLRQQQKPSFVILSAAKDLFDVHSAFANNFAPDININAGGTDLRANADAADAPTDVCSMEGVTCCPINDDGSYECYPFSSEDSYHIAVVDKQTGQAVAETEEAQNKSIHWFGYVPHDLGAGSIYGFSTIYGLGDEQGVKMAPVDGEFRVQGNHKDQYFDFATESATKVVMANNKVALLKPEMGIGLPTVTAVTANNDTRDVTIIDENPPVTVPDAKSYTVLKKTHSGDLMFGVESKPGFAWGKIRDVSLQKFLTFTDPDPLLNQNPEFKIPHKQTIAFDVQKISTNWSLALVVFEDKNLKKRIRLVTDDGNFDPSKRFFGGIDPLNGNYSFKDLVIYEPDSLPVGMGRALLLDVKGYVYMIDMHLDPRPSKSWLTDTDAELAANTIRVGKNPQALVLNESKTKAYVVNKDDDTVSVISLPFYDRVLTDRDLQKTQASIKTIKLKDYLTEKDIVIKPTQINYVVLDCKASLAIASEGLKGSIMVPLSVPESEACPQNNTIEAAGVVSNEIETEELEILPDDEEVVEVKPVKPLPNKGPIKPLKPIKPIKRPIKQLAPIPQIPDYEAPEVR